MRLRSNYKVAEIPHSEHPTPQNMRENWLCLNGKWDFYKRTVLGEKAFSGTILVPFSPECLLSGVDENFSLKTGESLVYSRTFTLPSAWTRTGTGASVTKLHFGAVDSECLVFVNGEKVGGHTGGFTPFSLDITTFLQGGENEIVVECMDEGTRNHDARGKQSDNRGGIWYTPQSGIWQTVWLENMPQKHIRNLKITPCALKKKVNIQADCFGAEMEAVIFDGETEILRRKFTSETTVSYDFELWSPENPKLYDLVLTSETGDLVRSYFGVRSFGVGVDKSGKKRLTLNGEPYFFNGVLDQGYFSDGMLTFPSDEAILDELKLMKEMGFNTLRKHIKIEPMRWYYYCDKLGLVVWQDFVNGGGTYKFTHIGLFPFLGFSHRDDDYSYFARENEGGRVAFKCMVDETLDTLYNCPCIGVWVPFNEGWGQFDSAWFTKYIKGKDATRIIDSVSGWHDQGEDKTELKSLHIYYTPLKVPKDSRPVVLSEFGGYSMKIAGHTFAEKEFGYKNFKSREKLVRALRKLYLKKLKPLIQKGLCACIYTQVSDVEEEINGFVTYDRAVVKVPLEEMQKINAEIALEAQKIQ